MYSIFEIELVKCNYVIELYFVVFCLCGDIDFDVNVVNVDIENWYVL